MTGRGLSLNFFQLDLKAKRIDMKRWMLLLCAAGSILMAAICGIGFAASSANADMTFESTSVSLTGPGGDFQHLAGAHPDLTFSADLSTVITEAGYEWPEEGLHDLSLELPPGFVGNPTSVPPCPLDKFYVSTLSSIAYCSLSSQVGWADVEASNTNQLQQFHIPIYNLDPGPNQPARFGFIWLGIPVFISSAVRPDDYGVNSGSVNTDQTLAVLAASVEFWGVPADSSHDPERGFFGGVSEVPPRPLLRNPTFCGPAATFTAVADSWEHRGVFDIEPLTSGPDGTPFAFERCEDLPFKPTMTARATSSRADAPTGLQVDIEVPQNESPKGRSTSDVRKVVTTLPAGMSVSDSSAQGLGACSQVELGIGSNEAPTCPDSSKIGTVKIKTPLLAEELDGAVYLAQQGANPFGTTLALYLAVKGPGFYLKLPGRVDADPQTGQLTTTFANTPQLPFENLRLELKSGPRAPLKAPRKCGTYAVKSEIVPWSGTSAVLEESKFQINEGCDSGAFSPTLRAGTKDSAAGSSSPFILQVTRKDGEENLGALDITLPVGLLAKLKGVEVCGDAAATTGNCPAASQVGRTTVGAGSGPSPVYVPELGKAPTAVYLAGPYKGAPYSLVVKVPAQAGPFDLGTVAVRSGIYIDPVTTAVSVRSDRLPQILEGIPISYRDVRVEVDREGFMRNPTSCKGMNVASTIYGSDGATATPAANFAATNCESLGFKPKLAIKFSGKTHRSAHPALKATLKMPAGGANIGKAVVLLPETEFIDNAHISNPCTRVQFDAGACPKGSILGTAKAYSPLIDQPLSGPVYFRSNGGARELPDLVADLNGQIHVTLVGFIDSVKTGPETARVRTRFLGVPDAPVSKFVLSMKGGDKGLIVNNTELCKEKPRAKVQLTGQNGKRSVTNPLIKLGCGKSSKKRK